MTLYYRYLLAVLSMMQTGIFCKFSLMPVSRNSCSWKLSFIIILYSYVSFCSLFSLSSFSFSLLFLTLFRGSTYEAFIFVFLPLGIHFMLLSVSFFNKQLLFVNCLQGFFWQITITFYFYWIWGKSCSSKYLSFGLSC